MRRSAVQRRRLTALLVAAALAGLLGLALGASTGDEGGPSERAAAEGAAPAGARARRPARPAGTEAAGLTLRQQAGQAVMLRFLGTRAPEYVLRALRERRVAGVVLFGDNIVAPDQLRALTAELREAGGGRTLIATDQEGGTVRNVPFAGPERPQPAITTPSEAGALAEAAAEELRAAGVNMNLAPVADTAGPVLGGRAFPGSPEDVAALVAASVRGYDRGDVLATAKHFPGLGAATANTDDAPVTITGVPDLTPFAAAVRAGVPLVMAAHARYPALDAERIASQSPAVLTGLLRERLGFRGVIVTDSLEAEAVVARSDPATAAVRSMRAGADLMLTTGRGSYLPVLEGLMAEAERDPAFRARLVASADRVLALTRR